MDINLNDRQILMYLNEIGYRNVTSSQLKEFIQDLRKLIKYEERFGINSKNNSKNKTKAESNESKQKERSEIKTTPNTFKEPKTQVQNVRRKKSGNKYITKCVKSNDPVELYQYYKKQWEIFKKNLPGEN